MKKVLFILFTILYAQCYSQTIKVDIEASYVVYSELHNKAFVSVNKDDAHYPNNLIQLHPYSGDVEKSILLNGNPKKIQLTEDHSHLYVSYYSTPKIDKIHLEDFVISESINVGAYDVIDFEVSPVNEDIVFVVLGEGSYAEKIVMFINGIIQPKQIEDFYMWASHISVKNDGTRLYGHNGENTGHDGYLIEVDEDGVSYNGIGWHYMVASFYEIKNHNDLIYGNQGHLVDPFSDSIPLMHAKMPIYKLTNSRSGFDYSEPHGCFIYGHETNYDGYISFFHGQYYNYLGSLLVTDDTDRIYDVDVVDENHFILVTYDANPDYKYSILLYSIEDKGKHNKHSISGEFNKEWFDRNVLIKLPVKDDSIHFQQGY